MAPCCYSKYLMRSWSWSLSRSAFDIFPFPSRVPLLYLQTVVGDVVRTLKVMYGSLDRLVGLSFPVVLLRELVETSPLWLSFFMQNKSSVFHQLDFPQSLHCLMLLTLFMSSNIVPSLFVVLLITSMFYHGTHFLIVSSAGPSVRQKTLPGWTISSACSSSSSSSRLAWGTAPQLPLPTSQGPSSSTDCRRSVGSRCLQKSRCICMCVCVCLLTCIMQAVGT